MLATDFIASTIPMSPLNILFIRFHPDINGAVIKSNKSDPIEAIPFKMPSPNLLGEFPTNKFEIQFQASINGFLIPLYMSDATDSMPSTTPGKNPLNKSHANIRGA